MTCIEEERVAQFPLKRSLLGYTMVLGSPERHEMYLMSVSNEKLLGQLCMVRMGDITTNTFMCHHSPECHRMYV